KTYMRTVDADLTGEAVAEVPGYGHLSVKTGGVCSILTYVLIGDRTENSVNTHLNIKNAATTASRTPTESMQGKKDIDRALQT
ncbi:hypothetical protein BaRGS_00012369, partial [Batillaria attramentaria]